MPGFISNQVLRPVNEDDSYVVFTIWSSRQDFLNFQWPDPNPPVRSPLRRAA
jgi:heme-degrading monooxygenase HmoA